MSSGAPPPPGANAGVAAWYELQRDRKRREELERKLVDFEAQVLRELGEVRRDLRELKLRTRQSGHRLEELEDWQENSKVHELQRQLEDARKQLSIRVATRKEWSKRVWALFAALVVVVAGFLLREFTHH